MGNFNTKIIVSGIIGLIVFFGVLVYLTYVEWITATQLIFSILATVLLIGVIIILYVFMNKKGADSGLMLKLNSTTMRKWVKEYMIEHYHENVEIDDVRYLIVPGRKDSEESHLGYVKLNGTTSFQDYHIIMSLKDPEGVNTILHGKKTIDEIHDEAKYLTNSSYRPKRRTVNYDEDNPSKIRSEINEDLVAPDVEEEIFNNVQKPKQK